MNYGPLFNSTNQRERARERNQLCELRTEWSCDYFRVSSLITGQASAWITSGCGESVMTTSHSLQLCVIRSWHSWEAALTHPHGPCINRVMLTIRGRLSLTLQVPDSDRDAFKLENLDAFYMSSISNSHSMLTL